MKKKVAILGAGPSGLAAAKAAIECDLEPVVFEKASKVGGLWRPGSVWQEMHTNLSKYSCMFSDFPWARQTSLFPAQHEIYKYLCDYIAKFNLALHIQLNAEVTSVSRENEKWFIQSKDSGGNLKQNYFDFVIVATGIFSKPNSSEIKHFDGSSLHSSNYKSPEIYKNKNVLVVGGAFSGAEISVAISSHAKRVINLIKRPSWVIPRYIPADPSKNKLLLPVDLVFYSRKTRAQPQEILFKSSATNKGMNSYFNSLCLGQGFSQDDKNQYFPDSYSTEPARVVISDNYLKCIKEGKIIIKKADIKSIHTDNVKFSDESQEKIDSIIVCNGYKTHLPFLDASILKAIGFQSENQFQPLLLHKCVFHPDLPNMAFVGMYRGPFFATMELQARWANMVFSGQVRHPSADAMREGIKQELDIREQKERPSFPHADYVGMADDIAREIGVFPDDKLLKNLELRQQILQGPVTPSHYRLVGPHAKPDLASQQIMEIAEVCSTPKAATPWRTQAIRYAVQAIVVGCGLYSIYKAVTPASKSNAEPPASPGLY